MLLNVVDNDYNAHTRISDINLPITGLAMALVVLFLKVKSPGGSFREKVLGLDWTCVARGPAFPISFYTTFIAFRSGNFLIIASASSVVIALSWAGVRFAWKSAQVLGPLVAGLGGIVIFFIYEATVAKRPLVGILLHLTVLCSFTCRFRSG